MLLLADQGPLEFLEVQGLHALLPHLYLNGNRPEPGASTVVFGLGAAAFYLVLAWLLSRRLARREEARGWTAPRRAGWRLLVLAAYFALLELSLHAWTAGNPYEMFVPDPKAFWAANPRFMEEEAREFHRVHSGRTLAPLDGIMDREHPPERRPGTWRILFLGHSQLLSIGPQRYAGPATYPKVLQDSGARGPAGEALECLNAGISGYSSWQGLLLLRQLAPRYRPDAVVLSFSYHDANNAFSTDEEIMTDDPRVHAARAFLYRSKVYLLVRRLILKGRAAWNDAESALARTRRVTPEQYERNLRAMARLAREQGFRLAVLSEPTHTPPIGKNSEQHREIARRVCGEEGLPFLDVRADFDALSQEQRDADFDDDIHMSVAGHREVARVIQPDLESAGWLTPGPGGRR